VEEGVQQTQHRQQISIALHRTAHTLITTGAGGYQQSASTSLIHWWLPLLLRRTRCLRCASWPTSTPSARGWKTSTWRWGRTV